MDLAQLIEKYNGIRLAKPADERALRTFFNQHQMSTKKISLQYERGPDFFAMMNARGHKSLTFVYENADGALRGVASISYRDGYVDGKLQTVGYLGDLRIAMDRHILREWKKLYAEIVNLSPELEDTGHATHYLTAVIDENNLARRTLVRNTVGGLAYNPLVPYRMVNIFKMRPWAKSLSLKKFKLEPLRAQTVNEAQEFLNREHSSRYFGEHNELRRRLEVWPNFSFGNCTIVRDLKGNIRGFCGYWDNSTLKRTRIFYHSRQLKFLSHALNLPKDGQELHFMYMTNFCVDASLPRKDRDLVGQALFDEGYTRFLSSPCNFLSFCEFSIERWSSARRRYLYFTTPMQLYTVTASPKIEPLPTRPPGFEMAIV
jgi:hypothetical protein